jgi:hypothetical protein
VSELEAAVKLLAMRIGLDCRFRDEADYGLAIELAAEALKLGRRLAAADVLAEAQLHGSSASSPIRAAFNVAAHVAERGRFYGGPGAAGHTAGPGSPDLGATESVDGRSRSPSSKPAPVKEALG